MSTESLLLEIGVEELPSSFVDQALAALPALLETKLTEARLTTSNVRALGTPRRLSVLVENVATRQPDVDEDVVGPPETAAFKDGAPTRAATAFADKLGIDVSALRIVEKTAEGKQKAGRFVVGRKREAGRDARELLGSILRDVCANIPFKKSMRWSTLEVTFGRPVQWLVALFGGDIIDFEFGGQRAGRTTRGHRFLAPATFDLAHPRDYVNALRERHVLADRAEREKTMMDRVAEAAKKIGGDFDPDPMLVSENASLVEEPFIVAGAFEERFLKLPASVIRAVARGHQRNFCVQKNDDELLPRYLVVCNTALDPAKIAKGNDRVMTARLADAEFFVEEDKKADIEARVEKTGGIVFHARLGSVRDKTARLERLAGIIASKLALSEADAASCVRAAHLCKFDLVSLMVSEFPELQGQMGRSYLLDKNEPAAVADAVRDHYRPISASDELPASDVARVVALADRVDTLTGCFAVGLAPTGAADPYALRRNAIAALRIMLEIGATDARWAKLSLSDLVASAYAGFEGEKLDLTAEATTEKLMDFCNERLRGLLTQATNSAAADSVLGGKAFVDLKERSVADLPARAMFRAKGLAAALASGSSWLATARTVTKRLTGISKSHAPVLHPASAFAASDADKAKNEPIVAIVSRLDASTRDLGSPEAVDRALSEMSDVAENLEKIFVETLVNDPADPLTKSRLELLSHGATCMLRIGDFTRLVNA